MVNPIPEGYHAVSYTHLYCFVLTHDLAPQPVVQIARLHAFQIRIQLPFCAYLHRFPLRSVKPALERRATFHRAFIKVSASVT